MLVHSAVNIHECNHRLLLHKLVPHSLAVRFVQIPEKKTFLTFFSHKFRFLKSNFSILMAQDNGATTDISKPIEFNSEDVDDGFQHFWLPMIFMAMPG